MINNLQILRAFAALSVIFVHIDLFLKKENLSPFGWAAVDIFFVISGFIMVYTTDGKAIRPFEFLCQRIIRIVPLYWLLTSGVFGLALVAPHLLNSTQADPVQLLKSLLFLPFRKKSGLVEPVLFVGWSLNYEMFFYVLFSISLSLRSEIGTWLLMGFLAVVSIVGQMVRFDNLYWNFYTNPIILEFALGMLIARLTRRVPRNVPFVLKGAALLSVLVAPFQILLPVVLPTWSGWPVQALLAGWLVTSIVLLHIWGWSLNVTGLLMVGDASYVLYLSHPYVTQILQRFAIQLPGYVGVGLALLGSVAVALVLHRAVERPLTREVRRWLGLRIPAAA
jgi:exopolysaccharide production protein ExoZ